MYELQKAPVFKRILAGLLDLILLGVLVLGISFSLSSGLGYEIHSQILEQSYDKYEKEYETNFDMTFQEYSAASEAEKKAYDDGYSALLQDQEAMGAYSMMMKLSLAITAVSLLLANIIVEFVAPMYFGNGQTIGKKVFGLGLVRPECTKISTLQLFIRTVLGKYTVETLVPVMIFLLISFGTLAPIGALVAVGLAIAQAVLLFVNKNHAVIHDLLSGTVVVELGGQMICENA